MAEESLTSKAKSAIKNVTGKDVDEVLEEIKAPSKDARAESLKARAKGSVGGGGKLGPLNQGGAGATGADLLHMMNPQKLMKTGGKVRTASQRADGCACRGKTRA